MKKTVYVVCVCVLFVLLFYEVKRNYETENDGTIIVPTGSFVSKVQKENQKTAYLTFDDGPSGNTKKIIKILEEKGAVATFFLIGKEITGERVDTVKELKKMRLVCTRTVMSRIRCMPVPTVFTKIFGRHRIVLKK